MSRKRRSEGEAGFTLIEALVALAIVAVMLSSIGTVIAGPAAPRFLDGQGRELALPRLSYSHF